MTPPGPSILAKLLMAAVRAYRLLLSPWLGSSCRFEPTCSAYALLALERHGAAVGGVLAVMRVSRCHPFCSGGHDPVPATPPALFSRLLPPPAGAGATPSSAEKTPS